MCCKNIVLSSVVILAAIAGSIAIAQNAQPGHDSKHQAPAAAAPEGMQLPPGWTSDDMKACELAGTPGKEHELLARGVGTWNGKCEMWMAAGMPGMKSECVSVVSKVFDGRYIQVDNTGDMMGMPFHGIGVNGFDNVSQKFVSTWIDNMGTGIMTGTGVMGEGNKTMTWNYTYNCPITKKPAVMREVDTFNEDGTMTLEMFGADPKTGKEFKMMRIDFTKAQ